MSFKRQFKSMIYRPKESDVDLDVEEYPFLSALLHVADALKRTWDTSLNYSVASGKVNIAIMGVMCSRSWPSTCSNSASERPRFMTCIYPSIWLTSCLGSRASDSFG